MFDEICSEMRDIIHDASMHPLLAPTLKICSQSVRLKDCASNILMMVLRFLSAKTYIVSAYKKYKSRIS